MKAINWPARASAPVRCSCTWRPTKLGPTLENAYFNTEIIDAYCRILILARQLGRVNYFTEGQTKELLDIKKRLGYDDVRFHKQDCRVCGDSSFDESYSDFVPRAYAFAQ